MALFTWGGASSVDGKAYKPGSAALSEADRVPWGAVLLGAKMDLEGFVRDMGWHDYGSDQPCGLCRANRTTIPWCAFGPDADWLNHLLDYVTYLLEYRDMHPLYQMPGITVHSSFLDILHVLDYKGLAVHWQLGILIFQVFGRCSAKLGPNTSKTTGARPAVPVAPKISPQTNSKTISWQFGIRKSPPPMNR